jgi:hypothetical protein
MTPPKPNIGDMVTFMDDEGEVLEATIEKVELNQDGTHKVTFTDDDAKEHTIEVYYNDTEGGWVEKGIEFEEPELEDEDPE